MSEVVDTLASMMSVPDIRLIEQSCDPVAQRTRFGARTPTPRVVAEKRCGRSNVATASEACPEVAAQPRWIEKHDRKAQDLRAQRRVRRGRERGRARQHPGDLLGFNEDPRRMAGCSVPRSRYTAKYLPACHCPLLASRRK